jgi:hypothetical protein
MQHTYCCTVNKFEVLENTLKLGQKKNILSLQVHKITGRTERSFPKSTGFELPKESMSLNLQHYPYIFWDKNFDWGLREQEHLETIEQET